MKKALLLLLLASFAGVATAEVRHVVTSDGVDLYVEIRGRGTPCLYIHGGPGSGSYWLQKFSGSMLERNFRMVYLDQRGAGRSASPRDGNYSMGRLVRDFEEVRAALGIKQWITMGHSFGGLLQMGYAQRHPEAMRGMMFFNVSLNLPGSVADVVAKACEFLPTDSGPCPDPALPAVSQHQAAYRKLRERSLFWKMGYASAASEKLMTAAMQESPYNHDQENAAFDPEFLQDFKPATASMRMPVLYFYGRTDWMVGPHSHVGVRFPRMLLWESAVGHVPFIENPADLARAIASYRKKFKL